MQLVNEAISVFFLIFFSSNVDISPVYSALSIFACYFFIYSFNKNAVTNLTLSVTFFVTRYLTLSTL